MKRIIEEPGFYLPEGWSAVFYDTDEKMTFHGWSSYTPQTHVFDQNGNCMFEYTDYDSGSLYINKTKEYFIAPLYNGETRFIDVERCNGREVLIRYTAEEGYLIVKRFALDDLDEEHQDNWIKDEGLFMEEPDEELKELLNGDETFRYKMLGRFQSDCECYLAYGNQDVRRLWAHSCVRQIKVMIALYNSFEDDKKPVWCNLNDIKDYKERMLKD